MGRTGTTKLSLIGMTANCKKKLEIYRPVAATEQDRYKGFWLVQDGKALEDLE